MSARSRSGLHPLAPLSARTEGLLDAALHPLRPADPRPQQCVSSASRLPALRFLHQLSCLRRRSFQQELRGLAQLRSRCLRVLLQTASADAPGAARSGVTRAIASSCSGMFLGGRAGSGAPGAEPAPPSALRIVRLIRHRLTRGRLLFLPAPAVPRLPLASSTGARDLRIRALSPHRPSRGRSVDGSSSPQLQHSSKFPGVLLVAPGALHLLAPPPPGSPPAPR